MKKPHKRKPKDFDTRFDAGDAAIDFSGGVVTAGLSKTIKLPPLDIPAWLAATIDTLAQLQANSRASVVRQLLVEAIESRKHRTLASA